jgi:hypothetical protein
MWLFAQFHLENDINISATPLGRVVKSGQHNRTSMRNDMSRFAPTFALLLFSLTGCATAIKDLRQDPSFTFDSVKTSGLHVGGVVSAVSDLSQSEVTTFSSVLRSGFMEERNDIYVHDPGSITSALGIERRSALLMEYRNTGIVSAKWLQEIRSKIPDARYVVFARIDEDIVTKERYKENRYHDNDKDKDKKNVIGYKIKAEATRRMNASLAVYDITTGALAWGGSVEKSRSANREYHTHLNDHVALLLDTFNRLLNEEEKLYPYPPIPTQRDVLTAIFRGFAENLPKPGK